MRDDNRAVLTLPVSARDHTEGPADALVTLVEYGDFECPHCGRAYPIVGQIQQRLGSRLRFVFRHFPLTKSHPHAQHAAEAAEAAGAQGYFYEMHAALFQHQRALTDRDLAAYAMDIGADDGRFEEELSAHIYAPRVREDVASGVRSGVNGTPTFFINGQRHNGAWDFDVLLRAVEAAASRELARG